MYICDSFFFEKLTYFEFDRIITEESYKFMISANFISNLTIEYLDTSDEPMLMKVIKIVIESSNVGVCRLYAEFSYLLYYGILNFDNEPLVNYCLEHARLLFYECSVMAILSWCYLLDGLDYIEEEYMISLLNICARKQFSYSIFLKMFIFAMNNSNVDFDELKNMLADLKVLADEMKEILELPNNTDKWQGFLNTKLRAYFADDPDSFNKICDEINKLTPLNYYNEYFKPFYELADYIYNTNFCWKLSTELSIPRLQNLLLIWTNAVANLTIHMLLL